MKRFVSHNSALHYWRLPPTMKESPRFSSAAKLLPGGKIKPKDIHVARLLLDLECRSSSLHLLVSENHSKPPHSEKATFHSWTGPVPRGSFFDAGCNVFVSSPEFLFLQMAPLCPFVTLIELGFEMCGGYTFWKPEAEVALDTWPSLEEHGEGGAAFEVSLGACGRNENASAATFSCLGVSGEEANGAKTFGDSGAKSYYERPPITSVAKIEAFLDRVPGAYGVRLARKALAYVHDNSASPQETKLAMALGLPCKYGGCGLGMPNMNESIPLSPKDRIRVTQSSYTCDLYWPEQHVAVEYDSSEHHLEESRAAKDSQRRSDLMYLGVRVVSITKRQARNNVFLVRTANSVAKMLGKRVRPRGKDYAKTCMELRANLFYGREIENLHLR